MGPFALLFPLLLSAAGTGMQMAAAQKARNAMNDKTQQELARQQRLQRESAGRFSQSLQGGSPEVARAQVGAGAQQREASYERAQAVPLSNSGAAPVANDPVLNARTKIATQQSNIARAANQGYSEWQLQQMIKNLQAGQDLGVLGSFARGSAAALPTELQHAQHAGDSLAGMGSLLGTAGTLMGMYNMLSPATVATAPVQSKALADIAATPVGGMVPGATASWATPFVPGTNMMPKFGNTWASILGV